MRRASLDILRIDIEDSFYYSNNIYYNTGNVGIGTVTVDNILQVSNGQRLKISNGSTNDTIIGTGDTEGSNTRIRIFGGTHASAAGQISYVSKSTGSHVFFTTDSDVERMRITSTGNVGIGTNNPQAFLDITYSSPSLPENKDMLNIKTDSNWGLKIQQSSSSGNIQYNFIHRYLTVDYNSLTFKGANVGIGTNDPKRTLHTQTSLRIGGSGAVLDFGDDFTTQIYRSGTTQEIGFSTSSTERMRITSTGNVGIGTNNPGYRLEVSGGVTDAGNFNAFYMAVGGTATYGGPWTNTIAKFNGNVWSTNFFYVSSDIRIKEDIQDIIDDIALQSILSIEPKTYKYVDKLERGDKKVYGFIAQQIRDVIPEAVSIQVSYIPNIYLVADYIDYVITLSSQPTKVVIKVNDKIKCYDKDNKEILVEVIEVIDDLTFRIKEIEYTDTKIFVYGTFVDDFHTLNKDYIFTLNVCATQELHRRIETQSVLLKSQDDRIKDLETKVATFMSV